MNKIKSTSCLLGILGAFCIVSTVFGGSVVDVTAYLSHRDEVNNQITVGDNTSHITEDFTSPDDVTPNTAYKKTVRVKMILIRTAMFGYLLRTVIKASRSV